jgi:hypothetical protein
MLCYTDTLTLKDFQIPNYGQLVLSAPNLLLIMTLTSLLLHAELLLSTYHMLSGFFR